MSLEHMLFTLIPMIYVAYSWNIGSGFLCLKHMYDLALGFVYFNICYLLCCLCKLVHYHWMFCWKAVLLLHLLIVSIYIPGFNQSWTEGKKNQQGGAFGAYQGARWDISRPQDACIRWKHEHVHCRRAAIQVNGFCCQVGTPRNVSRTGSMCFFF